MGAHPLVFLENDEFDMASYHRELSGCPFNTAQRRRLLRRTGYRPKNCTSQCRKDTKETLWIVQYTSTTWGVGTFVIRVTNWDDSCVATEIG